MGYREELTELVQKYTQGNIDITDNWNEWEEFLTKQGYIKTYDEVYEMDLDYLISNKDMQYWDEENNEWNVKLLIENDNDITKMENECYFVHCQQYIDEYDIELFYEEQEEKEEQKKLNWAINQAYIDLDISYNGFSRFDALLLIFGHNFGEAKIFFASDIKKVKKEFLKCFQDVLEIMQELETVKEKKHINTDSDIKAKLWLPNNIPTIDDEHYCDLIRFGGYGVFEDGHQILNANAIILQEQDCNQTLEYYTYENIHHLCNYIAELFEPYKEECFNVGGREYGITINKRINERIDFYWKDGKIDFDYAEFYEEH